MIVNIFFLNFVKKIDVRTRRAVNYPDDDVFPQKEWILINFYKHWFQIIIRIF